MWFVSAFVIVITLVLFFVVVVIAGAGFRNEEDMKGFMLALFLLVCGIIASIIQLKIS